MTYEKWINAKGGINGHPLQIEVCDDRGTPTQATACARKAVQDNVVAVVGSYSFFGDNIVPVLAASKISWFGECCAGTPSELTSPDSFPVGSSLMYAVGEVQRSVKDGCNGINAVVVDGAQPYIEPMQNAIKALGKKFVTTPIIVPQTSQDETALVAKATSGAQCLDMVLNESLFKPWFAALEATGKKVRMYGPQGNLDAVSIKGNETAANGDIVVGSYPDISTSPWADFRAALKQYNAPTTYDYNSLGGLGTWAGYAAFTQVVQKMSGPVTNTAFYDQATKMANLNLNGMVPPVNFTQPWTSGLKGYTRLFNRSVVFSQVKNGKIVPLTTNFANMSNLAQGKSS
jgi:ABC-type branched-subunit amino acid transport system substrate-binding protein